MDTTTQIGPLISEEQLNRVCGYLDRIFGRSKSRTGGKRRGGKGYFVEPTVLVNTSDRMKVVREEIFGPVVTVMPFSDVDDLIAKANNTPYGLGASDSLCGVGIYGMPKGRSAMGVYTGPNQLAYTVGGSSLDTNLNLNPGSYNTVVQAWDNCGSSSTMPVNVTVSSNAGQPGVQVSSPANNSTVSSSRAFCCQCNNQLRAGSRVNGHLYSR